MLGRSHETSPGPLATSARVHAIGLFALTLGVLFAYGLTSAPIIGDRAAFIYFSQTILRAEVEAIRGVAVGDVINRLREMNLVKIVGRAEDLGRPMLYGTTKEFLKLFGLSSLDDLPAVEGLEPPGSRPPRAARRRPPRTAILRARRGARRRRAAAPRAGSTPRRSIARSFPACREVRT